MFFVYFSITIFNYLFYYVFFPNFIKAILIIFIHSYFISFYMKNKRQSIIILTTKDSSFKLKFIQLKNQVQEGYFLSIFFKYLIRKKRFKYFFFGLNKWFIS